MQVQGLLISWIIQGVVAVAASVGTTADGDRDAAAVHAALVANGAAAGVKAKEKVKIREAAFITLFLNVIMAINAFIDIPLRRNALNCTRLLPRQYAAQDESALGQSASTRIQMGEL